MTSMDDLVAFLRARYDEDERTLSFAEQMGERERNGIASTTYPAMLEFLDHFSDRRIEADIAAKRRLLDEYEAMKARAARNQLTQDPVPPFVVSWLGQHIKHVALAYDHHPDYRPEWRAGRDG